MRAFLVTLLLALPSAFFAPAANAQAPAPLFGFTAFPYDATPEAVERTYATIHGNSTLYALHLDDGIPWAEALAGTPWPAAVQADWDEWKRRAPDARPVYLGLAPLAKDRSSLAPPAKGGTMPRELRNVPLDHPDVVRAYVNYARRAIQHFGPAFVNLGIEAGELASRTPSRWPAYDALYRQALQTLKQEFPSVRFGMSFGLQSLRKPGVIGRVRMAMESSDYVGLSFYPYASSFGEKFGDPPLGAREEAWREPLAWLRKQTARPLAICETGYTTREIHVPSFGLRMQGDVGLQASYVRELADTAKRDGYAFVVWFLAIDYDRLYERQLRGDEVSLLWKNIGLIDGNLAPKPGWDEWQRALGRGAGTALPVAVPPGGYVAPAAPAAPAPPAAGAAAVLADSDKLFQCGGGGRTTGSRSHAPPGARDALLWEFGYAGKDWAWCIRDVPAGALAGKSRLEFRVRSDRPGTVFVQVEERGGEAFFARIEPTADWSAVSLGLDSLAVDPAKKRNGRLEPGDVTRILIADPAAGAGASGRRSVWFSEWTAR
jgi:hypothetical protein